MESQGYFPKNVSIMKPLGEDIFEFFIQAHDEVGVFASIISVFARHNANIRSASAGINKYGNKLPLAFEINIFCNLTKCDTTVEQLRNELTRLPSISKVLVANLKNKLFDQFSFPTVLNGTTRMVLFRATPLVQIEKKLVERLGSAGEAIMFDEGRAYSDEAIKLFRESLPKASPDELLENIKDGFRATGWGIFNFKKIPNGFEVTVIDPYMHEDSSYNENRFLYGTCARIVENLYDEEYVLSDSEFDRARRKLVFVLIKK
ncbi:MAG: hypothetical protein ACYCQJ_06235 [Nitrososphaerales archaeon]